VTLSADAHLFTVGNGSDRLEIDRVP